MDTIEYRHYEYCLAHDKPYFGRVMWALQGHPVRHAYMQLLVEFQCINRGDKPFNVLEIGSWAGGSAITWANAIQRFNDRNGLVICLDPWKLYFDPSKYGESPDGQQETYQEMADALLSGKIYDLFLHNIRTSKCDDIVLPFKGRSDGILPLFGDERFDVVFVDGDHTYACVLKDMTNSARLVSEGGILCGDDLELQIPQFDLEYAKKHKDKDYILDPKTNECYHPGVSLAVSEFFGEVSAYEGFWAMRKCGRSWEKVELQALNPNNIVIPDHLSYQGLPKLLKENYKGFNIIQYWGKYYALAQALGPIDLARLSEHTLIEYQEGSKCFIGNSLAEVEHMVDQSGYRGSPELVKENYKGFNIVRYKHRFYALAQALGPVDLTQLKEHSLNEYQESNECVIADSIEEAKRLLDLLAPQDIQHLWNLEVE